MESELSVHFQVAVTLLRGVPDLSAYGMVSDPAVTELSHLITVVTDPARPNCSAVLTVRSESGEEMTVRVDSPRGQPATVVPADE